MSDVAQLVPGCITANPDIAGIGVRVAMYTQNFLALILAVAALGDRYVSWKELNIIENQSMSILLTACALLLSAVVQAVTLGMSTYHALVILNLAWMNNTNTFVYAILFRYQGITRPRATEESIKAAFSESPPMKKALPLLIIGSLHLSFVGCFGLWFWKTVDTFGATSQCVARLPISMVILGSRVPVTSRALRRVSMGIYGVVAVPGFNLIIVVGAIYGLSLLCFWIAQSVRPVTRTTIFFGPGYLSLAILVGINVVVTIDTETMIKHTKAFVQQGESQWTFGQTLAIFLAIFLLILPLRDIVLTLVGEDRLLANLRERRDRRQKMLKKQVKVRKERKKQTPHVYRRRPTTHRSTEPRRTQRRPQNRTATHQPTRHPRPAREPPDRRHLRARQVPTTRRPASSSSASTSVFTQSKESLSD